MAIAYDATGNGSVQSGTSLTYSHTCTGANLLLFVVVSLANAANTVTGVTYNGVAMTQIQNNVVSGANLFLFYLIAPATGANNIVISTSGGANTISSCSASYTGCKQSSQPDNSAKASAGSVVESNGNARNWIIGCAADAVGIGTTYTAGSGFTLRQSSRTSGGNGCALEDSNGTVPTGNNTVSFGISTGSIASIIAASMNNNPIVYTISAAAGSYSITGFAAIIGKRYKLSALKGSFSITGFAIGLLKHLGWHTASKSSEGNWDTTLKS